MITLLLLHNKLPADAALVARTDPTFQDKITPTLISSALISAVQSGNISIFPRHALGRISHELNATCSIQLSTQFHPCSSCCYLRSGQQANCSPSHPSQIHSQCPSCLLLFYQNPSVFFLSQTGVGLSFVSKDCPDGPMHSIKERLN